MNVEIKKASNKIYFSKIEPGQAFLYRYGPEEFKTYIKLLHVYISPKGMERNCVCLDDGNLFNILKTEQVVPVKKLTVEV